MKETERKWTAAQRKYMVYLATPSEDRTPLNETNFAETVGVAPVTLWRWKQLPGFYAEVNKLVDEHLADDYGEILDSFKRQARKGSYPHQKTYFEMLGKYKPAQDVSGDIRIHVTYDTSDSPTEDGDEGTGEAD